MSDEYKPGFTDRQHIEAAQQIRRDILALVSAEDRRPALYAAIRQRLLDAAAEVEAVIEMYQTGEEV
jgi:hypothetical protein